MALTERPTEPAAAQDTACCAHRDHHHPPAAEAEAPESARERVNRRWNEILQETRVTQTGVQILFGFLLSVAFTPLFRELETLDRTIYVTTVVLGAAATGALIAPVSMHRFLSGQRMKDDLVETAARMMMCGMVLLALTIGCTLLLILRFVVPGVLAELLVGAVMLWFGVCWYALPLLLRRRAGRRDRADEDA
jgi:fatty acid desaturase